MDKKNSISVALGLLGPRNSLTPHTGVSPSQLSKSLFLVLFHLERPFLSFLSSGIQYRFRPSESRVSCEFVCKQERPKAEHSLISKSSRFATLLLGKTYINTHFHQPAKRNPKRIVTFMRTTITALGRSFVRAKWHNLNFRKVGGICTVILKLSAH